VDLGCIVLLSDLYDNSALIPMGVAKISNLTHGAERAFALSKPNGKFTI
jgi:hypothetical protein